MSKKKCVFGKIVSKIVTATICTSMAISCIALNASATNTRYTFQSISSSSGESWWMSSAKKEYANIAVICDTPSAYSKMALWKDWVFGDVHYDQDQTITVGTGRRVWWYGDTVNSAQYHITADVSNNYGDAVAFTGNFRNFS